MTPPPPAFSPSHSPSQPPWRDAHLHLAEHGQERACIDLAGARSLDEALRRIAGHADEAQGEGWIKATGARAQAWPEQRLPNADELHHAGRGRPVVVVSFDHHALSASRRVLDLAGVTRDTPARAHSNGDALGASTGLIEKDPRTGEPTGVFIEGACALVRAVEPPVTHEQRVDFIRVAQDDLLALGIVEVHDMFATADLVRALRALDARGELRLKVVAYAPPAHLESVIAALETASSSPRITLAGLKLFTDGTLNSRTASMLHPYAQPAGAPPAPPSRGTPFYTDDELLGFMRAMRARNLDIAAHAIGDAAVRRLLDLWDTCAGDGSRSTLRIEHAQFIDEQDIPRLAAPEAQVIVSMQPCHLLTDIEAIRRLAPHRAHRAFPLRDLIDACARVGVDPARRIVLGSDTPVVRPDPGDNLQAAVERRRAGAPMADAIAPSQAITRERCATLMRPACA